MSDGVNQVSFYKLGCELCEKYSTSTVINSGGNPLQDFISGAEKSREQQSKLSKNKRTLFGILLKKRPTNVSKDYEMPIRDKISSISYEYENAHQKDKADTLLDKFSRLPTDDESTENILKFLIKLKDTHKVPTSQTFTDIGSSIKCYGTTIGQYREFPPALFHCSPPASRDTKSLYKQFTPAMFTRKIEYRDVFSLQTRFGMDSGRSEEVRDTNLRDSSVHDEGYNSPDPEEDIWDKIWTVDVSQRMTWESLGRRTSHKEKPFLTEAGPDAVHNVWRSVMESVSVMDPGVEDTKLVTITLEKLTLDLGYLLAGIDSSTFLCDANRDFQMTPGVTLRSLSPECLAAFCQDFLTAGSFLKKLEYFCTPSHDHNGKIVSGFVQGIRKYLRVHINSVLSLSRRFAGNLGELRKITSPMMQQILFLAKVCGLERDEMLPSGVALISKLLDVSVHVSDKTVNLLLISLLSSSSGPYLRFLKTWIFSGEVEGYTKEFGLEIDPYHINSRDEMYWKAAYNLIPIDGSNFLADIQQKVHLTGKSLALLRLICPDHHLAGIHRDLQPSLHLAVSADQQLELQESCKAYETTLQEVAKECSETYSQKRAKEEEAKQKKIDDILQMNRENQIKREGQLAVMREEKLKKQQKLYTDLQDQARAVKERKLKEKQDKEKEDLRISDEAEKMEEEVRQREAEEKRRLEEFYARLNADAELRQRRAEWRMKRSDPALKNKRLAQQHQEEEFALTKSTTSSPSAIKSPRTNNNSSIETPYITTDQLKIDKDDMGNVTVMVEDDEGNLVTEIEYSEDIQTELNDILANDNFDSISEDTKSIICQKIQRRSLDKSPGHNVNTRMMNKDLVLGSQIDFNFIDPVTKSKQKEDNIDYPDGNKKRSTQGQQIERILYPQRFNKKTKKEEVLTPTRTDFQLSYLDKPLEYTKTFKFEAGDSLQEMGGQSDIQEPAEGGAFAPLTLILQNSILVPLRVQARLVDAALLNHILVDRELTSHLSALRHYLLLADGEFGRQLVTSLCSQLGQASEAPSLLAGQLYSHLVTGSPPPHLLSPATLNRVLDTALASSALAASDPMTKNLTFLLDPSGQRNIGIPGLSLTYQAAWPENIILSVEAVTKYSTILDFQLELRLAMLSLELDWANENLVVRRDKKATPAVLHKVNLMRHEMMHFIRNLHDYVTSQVLEISWRELQDNLLNKVTCLDDLIATHEKYLNRAIFRCLLNPKAAPVMKIVRDIFSSITKFSALIATRMTGDEEDNWIRIEAQYKTFSQYSRYFFGLVAKLAARGYQPHLQDLLLRLNFNGFYNK